VTSTTSTESPVGLDTGALVRRSLITFVCMVGLGAAFTILFFSMRSVMDIGGRCYSGNVGINPDVVQQCPDGVPGLMIGSIFGGLIFLGIYAFNAIGPNLTLLAWPALFISLGWNFLEYAFSPPDGSSGIVWGWLICGVLFVLMGGLPLVFGIKVALDGKESRISRIQAKRRSVANRYGRGGTEVLATRTIWIYGLVLQLAAIGVGIWVGIEIFESATDSTIRFG
jgi:hypothetical protein